MTNETTRRRVLGGAAGLAAAATLRPALAAMPMPRRPVEISIVDVAGNLALTQPAFEAYRRTYPKRVSRLVFTKAPAPELPGKLKAMQAAGRTDIDLVLTGIDALAAGIGQNLYVTLLPAYASDLPDPAKVYLPGALAMQGLAKNQGLCVTYSVAGPLIEYNPAKVDPVPKTVQEVLSWCQAHPKKFIYARPANSGPARIWLMGLPYILGDRDPKDPKAGWDKTWAYLAALGKTIEYYPSGTAQVMQELGNGTRDMIPTQTGWDIDPRALGVVPKADEVGTLAGFHWICDAHYMCVPKGVSKAKLAVLLDMMSFVLQPKQQAVTYDDGYFYPGPAVKDVPLSMAPAHSQQVMAEFGRPFYDKLIATVPIELPLDATRLVYALDRWDKQIGTVTAK